MKNSRFYLSAILAVGLWGTTFALSKFLVPHKLDPISFTAIRTLLGFIFLLSVVLIKGQFNEWILLLKKHTLTFMGIGMGIYAFSYMTQYWAITKTTASNQAIISNTQTFFVVFFNVIFFKQKIHKRFILGSIGAFIGLTIVLLNEDFSLSSSTLPGDLLSLLAFAMWGAYTAFSKPISTKEDSLLVTTSIILFANFLLLPVGSLMGMWDKLSQLSALEWGIVLYLGFFCIGLTFVLWTYALSRAEIPSEKIAIITMLNPIIGIITSIILLGEVITLNMIIGTIILFIFLYYAETAPYIHTKNGE